MNKATLKQRALVISVFMISTFCGWLIMRTLKHDWAVPLPAVLPAKDSEVTAAAYKDRTATWTKSAVLSKLSLLLESGEISESAEWEARILLVSLSKFDRALTLRWLFQHGMPWDTKDFCEQIVRDASPQELTKLMDEVQNQPSAPLRSRLLKAVIETIDPAGLPSALQRLEAPPGPDQATAAAILAHLRSQADSTVLGFLSRNSKAPWLEGAVLEAMQHAAKRSSSEAWATIELLTDRKLVALAREAVLTTEAKTQPLTACNRLLALPRSSPRGQLAGAILSEWSRTSPEAAVTWLNANLSGPEKHKATSDMLLRLGGSVPAPLWPLIDELPSESLRRTALRYSQPELPASIAPPEAFQRAAEWKSEGREGAALSHYLAALSATDFNNAWAVVNSADYPSEHRITHMAQLLVDKQSSLDNIANVITEQAGEHAPAVALRILAENRPKLRVQQLAELEAMAGLVKHDSR